jgi:hypothetical protein
MIMENVYGIRNYRHLFRAAGEIRADIWSGDAT